VIPTLRKSESARGGAAWLPRGGGALLASAVVHAAVAATVGGVLVSTRPSVGREPDPVAVDLADLPADAPATPGAAAAPAPTSARPALRSRLAVRPARATAPTAAAPAGPLPPNDEAPLRFAISAGTIASGPSIVASGPPSGAGRPSDEPGPLGEGDVSVPARLITPSPLVYPPAARQAGIEIDLPVEIVVDATGRVVAARGLGRAGYGLDEAALRAIRAYRFSPAIRAGRPVPVRMRWTVQFRLR
jgi:protein TonB